MNSQYNPQFSINDDREHILQVYIHLANDTLSVGTENKTDTINLKTHTKTKNIKIKQHFRINYI